MKISCLFATAVLSLAALQPVKAQLIVVEIGRVDLSPYCTNGPGGGSTVGPGGLKPAFSRSIHPSYIGTNPSAIAWNGLDLFVAGFNGNTISAQVGIVRIPSAFQPSSGFLALDPVFGKQIAPTQRGYSGLDLQQGSLFAAYDPGAVHPQGISAHNQAGKLLWAKSARGSCGVGYDPGFSAAPGQGIGTAYLNFGANGRALQNAATGGDIFTTASGMSLLNPEGSFWRDIDFDPLTGDAWVREGNNVLRGIRSGFNSIGAVLPVVNVPDADFVIGQNLAYCNRPAGSVVVYNDRDTNGSTQQAFNTVVKIVRPDGSIPQILDLTNPQPAGAAYYDFAWDAATGTLAIVDFTNRQATLWALGGTP